MINNKGITLIALVVMVVILVIIASVTVTVSMNVVDVAKFENVETDLLLIQSKAKVIADKKAIGEIEEEELYGTKQDSGEYENWYLLSQTELEDMGLKKAKAEDNYYVNYENDDVAYGVGIEYKGTTYYKLSEMRADS